MQCQPLLEKQQEEGRRTGGADGQREGAGAEGAGRGPGECLPPPLSQPHGWLRSPLIVIAVQTRLTAATNISCSIWHTCTLSDGHTHGVIMLRCQSLVPSFMAPGYLSVSLLLTDKTAAALIAVCKVWQFDHTSNRDVPLS